MLKIKNFETGQEISTDQAATPAAKRKYITPRRSNDVKGKRKVLRRDQQIAEQILLRVATGMPHAIIGKMFSLSDEALHKLYQPELDEGLAIANSEVAGRLYTAATKGGNIVAMIFWLKSRAGWRDMDSKHEHEHKHQFKTAYDIDKMSEA
jgi:hypothetical protein